MDAIVWFIWSNGISLTHFIKFRSPLTPLKKGGKEISQGPPFEGGFRGISWFDFKGVRKGNLISCLKGYALSQKPLLVVEYRIQKLTMVVNQQQEKVRQREAVENAFDNLVEPQLKVYLQVQSNLPLANHLQPEQAVQSLFLAVIFWFLCLGIHLRHLCQINAKK
jgi:hypothetical protein